MPWTTMPQTTNAASGTTMYFDTPKSSKLLATPANSPMMLKKFVTNSASISTNVARSPNSSRMRSLRPLPVTAPIRDDISWMITSAIVIGIIVHRSV